MSNLIQCVSPVDGSVYAERPASTRAELAASFADAASCQKAWAATRIEDRCQLLAKAVDYLVAKKSQIGPEISWQMGRPVGQSPGELGGLEERARFMLSVAAEALGDIVGPDNGMPVRRVKKVPLGVVFVIAPWNFPYLTATNAIFPALAAGNAVVLKHSAQTLLCGERFAEAFTAAGLPEGVFRTVSAENDDAVALIEAGVHDHLVFTGSVGVGRHLQQASSRHFRGIDLELGGKDPAYVRADADLDYAAEQVADGAYFNAGQSCCGIERIYVHRDVYQPFVDRFVAVAESLKLGNPLDPESTLGPVIKPAAAAFVRGQINEAVAAGAMALVDPAKFEADQVGSAYLAPQVLVDVDHQMRVMTEESFGPVVGIMPVDSDDHAVVLMNDSDFGLTSSIWTSDLKTAEQLSDRIQTGTCFANRCDYLDPALAWTGVKDTGRGCSLSVLAYDHLTRPKSFNFRAQPG